MKRIKRLFFILLLLVVIVEGAVQAGNLQKPFVVDYDIYNFNIKMDSWQIKPKTTPYKFQIDISYLPVNETSPRDLQSLPVIYVTDGQWRRMDHKYIHYLTYKKMIPPVLVVGIGYPDEYNADLVRTCDLVTQAGNFLAALKNEIIPLVEKKYHVDPKRRYLFGASAGGHFTAYAFLSNSLKSDPVFHGYIGSSSYLPGTDVSRLANVLVSINRTIKADLYLTYGGREGYLDYAAPNNELFKILANKNIKGLHFRHHVYPGSDHFTNTRLTLIDGLRLFLGNDKARGIGAVDLKYRSYWYNFKTNTQVYDWKSNFFADYSWSTDPKYSHDREPGSFKVAANFAKYDLLTFETASVYFEGMAGRDQEFNIYIPGDLAKLNYSLKFLIYSTQSGGFQWISDYSDSFALGKNGWNTFKYKWRGKKISGNADCIRGFGVMIERPTTAPVWKGDIYFDDIKW